MRAKTLLSLLFLAALGVAGYIFLKAMAVEMQVEGPEALVAAATWSSARCCAPRM